MEPTAPHAEKALSRGVLRSRLQRIARAAVTMVVFGVPVVVLAFAVRQQSEPVLALDRAATSAATGFARDLGLVPLLLVLQEITQPLVVYAAATLVVVWVGLATRARARALWAFVTMMGSWGVGALAKVLVQRARPVLDLPLAHPNGYSFPSGHALNITSASAVLLILLWPLLSDLRRWLLVGVAVVAVLLVDLDRVLLGVHFVSDVIAGLLVGLGLTLASWTAFVRPMVETSSPEQSPPRSASGG